MLPLTIASRWQVSSEAYKFISAIPKFDTVGDLNVTMTTSSDPGYVNGFKAGALRYSLSKLMNILFAKELQKRFDAEDVDIVSLSLHPGIVATGLFCGISPSSPYVLTCAIKIRQRCESVAMVYIPSSPPHSKDRSSRS